MSTQRQSDRWITPGVIVAGLLVAGVVILATVYAVTYLASIGKDPDPMLRLVAQVVTAGGSLGTLLLTLTGRSTVAKVERNTGVLANQTHQLRGEVQEALYEPPARHMSDDTSYALPPVPGGPVPGKRAAPVPTRRGE